MSVCSVVRCMALKICLFCRFYTYANLSTESLSQRTPIVIQIHIHVHTHRVSRAHMHIQFTYLPSFSLFLRHFSSPLQQTTLMQTHMDVVAAADDDGDSSYCCCFLILSHSLSLSLSRCIYLINIGVWLMPHKQNLCNAYFIASSFAFFICHKCGN